MSYMKSLSLTDEVFSLEHNEARKKAYEDAMYFDLPYKSTSKKNVDGYKTPIDSLESLGESVDYILEALKERDKNRGIESDIKISDIMFIIKKYDEFKKENLLG